MENRSAAKFDDLRDMTYQTRVAIGFSDRNAWRDAPAQFDGHTLTIQGHPVMEDWEDGYMRELACITASGGGTVLEVGYGMGISARYIQQYPITRHIIIEANTEVFDELESFAAQAKHAVTPFLGFWEDVVPALASGSLTGILFDTYPLREDEIHTNHFPFFKEAHRLLAPGGTLTYYSDEIDSYSPTHRQALMDAGFTDISQVVCPVSPPTDCAYWKYPTILAPIVRK